MTLLFTYIYFLLTTFQQYAIVLLSDNNSIFLCHNALHFPIPLQRAALQAKCVNRKYNKIKIKL